MNEWMKFCHNCAGQCLEYQEIGGGKIRVRNSADPDGPSVVFTEHELDEFAAGWQARRR